MEESKTEEEKVEEIVWPKIEIGTEVSALEFCYADEGYVVRKGIMVGMDESGDCCFLDCGNGIFTIQMREDVGKKLSEIAQNALDHVNESVKRSTTRKAQLEFIIEDAKKDEDPEYGTQLKITDVIREE